MVVAGGLVALAVCAAVSKVLRQSMTPGARIFIAVWLLVALGNLYLGTTHGHSAVQELPFFLIVFGVPALVAFALMRWEASG
jgi:hypothetical protein